jgi:hypothetical protein
VTDLRQLIIDRATTYNEEILAEGEPPIRWTPGDLAEAITEFRWTDGLSHTCDLPEIVGTLNSRFKNRKPEPKPESGKTAPEEETEATAQNGTPFLLPIANLDGYSVDPHGRVYADKRPGRKAGPLALDKFFRKKGEARQFVCGYRVRVGDKRKRFTPNYMAMARFFAEQKWMNEDL